MAAKKPVVDPNQTLIDKYTAAGLTDVKNTYVKKVGNKQVFDTVAADKAVFDIPKITKEEAKPDSFTKAVTNYSNILSQAQQIGVANLNAKDQQALKDAARFVRDFDSKNLSLDAQQVIENITEGTDIIDQINEQRKNVEIQQYRSKGLDVDGVTKLKLSGKEREAARGRLVTEQDTLRRLEATATNTAPKLNESLSRLGLSDIGVNISSAVASSAKVDTGLEALRGERLFGVGTGTFGGRLNSQITDEQILGDINTARRNEYKSLYDIGTAAVTDLQSQLSTAQAFLADLPTGDRRRTDAQKTIDNITKELSDAQADTLEARNLYENYQPLSGGQATTALTQFRENLRLPEQRTLDQIKEIDPNLFNQIQALSKQYGELATTPLGATTAESTEALRRQTEESIAAQLRLGSQLGAEEQRQYQQAARAAQTARGNIFGVAPAVEEAVTTGLAGEQRLAARLGAAQGFLSSGQTVTDALARDVGLRNALQQSRLGAAAEFAAAGPSAYNMANQRAAQQQALLQQYVGAATQQATSGFQATPSQFNPYAYVNPNAGFIGAQNAAQIYNTLADYQAQTYGAQTSAIASSYRSPFQNAGSLLSGISGFSGMFGGPGSNAFFRA
jgi:hypothetical protein